MKKLFTLFAIFSLCLRIFASDYKLIYNNEVLKDGSSYDVGYKACVEDLGDDIKIYTVKYEANLMLQAPTSLKMSLKVTSKPEKVQFCGFDGCCIMVDDMGCTKVGNTKSDTPENLLIDIVTNELNGFKYLDHTNTVVVTAYPSDAPEDKTTVTINFVNKPIGEENIPTGPIDASTVSAFELGKTYSIAQFKNFMGTIELPAGKVVVYNMPDGYIATDEAGNNPISGQDSGYGTLISDDGTSCYGQIVKYTVPQAGTYYFSNFSNFIWDNRVFGLQVEGAQPIQPIEITPAAGSTVSSTVNSSGSGYLLVNFNVPVTFEQAYIKCGDITSSTVTPVVNRFVTNMNVQLIDLMKHMYEIGLFAEEGGTPFQVIIEGITNESGNLYGSDGTLTIDYVAGPKLMNLLSATMDSKSLNGQEFSTFWAKDASNENGPGTLVFTFDHNLVTNPSEAESPYLEIGCGNIESESAYYFEKALPAKIFNTGDQGTIYFDLRGVNRHNGIRSIGSTYAYNGAPVSVKLCNVKDSEGNLPEPVLDANGNVTNVGSYSYTLLLKLLPEQTIDFEFTPANGGILADCETLELWHNNLKAIISFDGILFAYEDNTSDLVPAADLVNSSTEPGEAVYKINIPARAKTEPVEVSMHNVLATDGYEKNISAAYNQFVVTYCSPFKQGGEYAEIPADPYLAGDDSMTDNDKLIHIRTNYYAEHPDMFIRYSIDDITDPNAVENLHSTEMKRLYSSPEYVGCAMNHAQDLHAGHTYAITFTAWESEADYWTGAAPIGKYAIQFYGLTDPFVYSDIYFVSISPDPNDGPILPSQNEFVVTYDGLVKLNDYTGVPGGMGIGLLKVDTEPIDADPDNGGFASQWKVTVPVEYMTGTALDLHVGAVDVTGLTVEGDIQSKSEIEYKAFSFLIDNAQSYVVLSSNPADGSTVAEISEITLTATDALGINWTYSGPGIQIYDKASELIHTLAISDNEKDTEVFVEAAQQVDGQGNPVFDELNNPVYSETTYITLRLKQPITAEGEYTICIPEAYFMVGSQFVTNYNAATNIALTVDAEPSTGLTSVWGENPDSYEVYDLRGIKVMSAKNAAELRALPCGLYVINGKKYFIQ